MADHIAEVETIHPRVRTALHLYATAQEPTQYAASTAAGLHPNYLTSLLHKNPIVQQEYQRMIDGVEEKAIDMGVLLHKLSVKALGTIETMMDTSGKDEVRLKAAIDLADRGPLTSKIQRHTVDTFTVSPEDAQMIASAMLESAQARVVYAELAVGSRDETEGDVSE